jgi:hypothetical protein
MHLMLMHYLLCTRVLKKCTHLHINQTHNARCLHVSYALCLIKFWYKFKST